MSSHHLQDAGLYHTYMLVALFPKSRGARSLDGPPRYPDPSLFTFLWFGWGSRGQSLVNSHQSWQVPELTGFRKECGHVQPCLPWAQKWGRRLASESSQSVGTISDSSPTSQPEGMDGWTDKRRLVEGAGSQTFCPGSPSTYPRARQTSRELGDWKGAPPAPE